MPAWASGSGKFAYVTRRNGPMEIWMRNEDGADRPIVTPADFAPAQINFFMNPTLTPDGDRVIYTVLEVGKKPLMYISSTSYRTPTRVTNADGPPEFASSISPDGKQLAYLAWGASSPSLRVVRTSGQTTATSIREKIHSSLPQWSPDGQWITFQDDAGWHLISPDGKAVRDLGEIKADYLTFSIDGKKLYGIRGEKDHQVLFSLEANGGVKTLRTIAELSQDYAPSSEMNPGYRLSVAPDGTCAIYAISTTKSSIWMMEGFREVR
jgi:TolB protein